MTPEAGESPTLFSELLLKHAAVNDLRELMPVGHATLAQGIRRGNGKKFFFELRAAHFLPLGPNHPAAVTAGLKSDLIESQSFPNNLCHAFKGLENWQWSIANNHTGKSTCAPLRFQSGWDFFDKLQTPEPWSMALDEQAMLIISRSPLPPFSCSSHVGWLRVFFTDDVLGVNGRLNETRNWLRANMPAGDWEGHVFRFKPNGDAPTVVSRLAERGLAVDEVSGDIVLTFPVSFFYEDVQAVAALLQPYQS
jgi:hypothetical protein